MSFIMFSKSSSSLLTSKILFRFRQNSPKKYFSTTSPSPSSPMTHFGSATVKENEKAKLVAGVFDKVATSYDDMNDLMSAGLHRLWKDEFVRMAEPLASDIQYRLKKDGSYQSNPLPIVLLDVAGGTGDIAFRLIDSLSSSLIHSPPLNIESPTVIVCDINPNMLAVGEARSRKRGLSNNDTSLKIFPKVKWQQGDAENLSFLKNESVDLYTIAFGIRNVTRIDKALQEAYRVLRPGGRFMCLEFSRVVNPLLSQMYDIYSTNVIPTMGQIVANDRASYQYLVDSIRRFPDQESFADMIEEAGFKLVKYKNLSLGVCAIHSGFKWK